VKRVLPISSLRFVLAAWVVVGHFFPPILRDHQHSVPLIALRAFLNNAVNGPAAGDHESRRPPAVRTVLLRTVLSGDRLGD